MEQSEAERDRRAAVALSGGAGPAALTPHGDSAPLPPRSRARRAPREPARPAPAPPRRVPLVRAARPRPRPRPAARRRFPAASSPIPGGRCAPVRRPPPGGATQGEPRSLRALRARRGCGAEPRPSPRPSPRRSPRRVPLVSSSAGVRLTGFCSFRWVCAPQPST